MPAFAAVVAFFAWQAWRENHVELEFVRADGAVPALTLTMFPDRYSFTAPSPPPAIGQLQIDDGAVTLGRDLVPERAFVRYAGQGVGTGYVAVEIGKPVQPIPLRAPAQLSGRVGDPQGVFLFGLRCLGLRPAGGARVFGLGGGEQGVVLCETVTDADGRFVLDGFDSSLPVIGVRVLQPGFAIAHVNWYRAAPPAGQPGPIVPLVPTQLIRGVVELPDGVDARGLRLLAKGLPGVETSIAADGTFALDHVPPIFEPRLLVHGLPETFTHGRVNASPGQSGVRIEVVRAAIVRGFVVERATQRAVAGAMVWHPHGPAGQVAVDTASDGSFVLRGVPPGTIRIGAQAEVVDALGQKDTYSGARTVEVHEGADLDRILVEID